MARSLHGRAEADERDRDRRPAAALSAPHAASTCSWRSGSSSRSSLMARGRASTGCASFDERILARPRAPPRARSRDALRRGAHRSTSSTLQRLASALVAGLGDARRRGRAARCSAPRTDSSAIARRVFVLDRERQRARGGAARRARRRVAGRALARSSTRCSRPGGRASPGSSLEAARRASCTSSSRCGAGTGEVVGVVGGTFRPDRRGFERMLAHLRRGRTGLRRSRGRERARARVARCASGRAKSSECARRARG